MIIRSAASKTNDHIKTLYKPTLHHLALRVRSVVLHTEPKPQPFTHLLSEQLAVLSRDYVLLLITGLPPWHYENNFNQKIQKMRYLWGICAFT
jgi:hypothetical protein